jgi:hypothetical protein
MQASEGEITWVTVTCILVSGHDVLLLMGLVILVSYGNMVCCMLCCKGHPLGGVCSLFTINCWWACNV